MNVLHSCKLTSLLRAQCICNFLVYYRHVTLDMLKIELIVQPNFHSNPPPNTSPPTEFSLLNKAVTIHTFSAVNSFETVRTFSPFFPPTPHLIDDISISILLQILIQLRLNYTLASSTWPSLYNFATTVLQSHLYLLFPLFIPTSSPTGIITDLTMPIHNSESLHVLLLLIDIHFFS